MSLATLLDAPAGTLPRVPLPEQLLTPLPANRPRQLATEIAALREALACVTPGAESAVVHGRIDSLIAERTTELLAHYAAAVEAGRAAAHGADPA